MKLMKSYFTNCYNRVKLGNTTSSWKYVDRGCPQGSSFEPLLWNIYQNDLTYITKSRISMFADDHQLYVTHKNVDVIQQKLQDSAVTATDWYEANYLQGNFSKYASMLIGKGKLDATLEININGSAVTPYQDIKLLGANLDCRLTFANHISQICRKASQKGGVIMRLRNLIPTNAKLELYKAAILPHLIYCSTVWHFCKSSDSRKLERVQERALRAGYCDWTSTYEQLLSLANLPTLLDRRLQAIAILMYKVKHNICPTYICDLFSKNQCPYNIRIKEFVIPRVNTVNHGKHSVHYLGPVLWAKLPIEIRASPSILAFKKAIRNLKLSEFIEECK